METKVRGNDRVVSLPYNRAEATGISHYRGNTEASKWLSGCLDLNILEAPYVNTVTT